MGECIPQNNNSLYSLLYVCPSGLEMERCHRHNSCKVSFTDTYRESLLYKAGYNTACFQRIPRVLRRD